MNTRRTSAAVALLAAGGLAVTGLTACDSSGSGTSASDMRAWQADTQVALAGDSLSDEALVADCSGAITQVRSDMVSVPDPPYKGKEWRTNTNDALNVMDQYCDALDSGNFYDTEYLDTQAARVKDHQRSWVNDANSKFNLNWDSSTYLMG